MKQDQIRGNWVAWFLLPVMLSVLAAVVASAILVGLVPSPHPTSILHTTLATDPHP